VFDSGWKGRTSALHACLVPEMCESFNKHAS
jgi:hypothetical protein